MTETLTALFDELHAERERTWPPEQLAANVAQRRALVAAFDPRAVVRAGDRIAPFTLDLPDGPIGLDELTVDGPVALIFFRFAGCPACNIALPFYDRHLAPALRAHGIRTVAVTPHLQAQGADAIRERHDLGFPVATDPGNALGRRFGIAFVPADAAPPPSDGSAWIGSLTGTGTHELPQPAIVVIDADRIVRFADISPDWLRRTEPAALLATLETAPDATPSVAAREVAPAAAA